MPDPKKYDIGRPINELLGGSHNSLVDDYFVRRGAATQVPSAARSAQPYLQVQCHNSTSTDLAPGEILGFSQPIFTVAEDSKQVYDGPTVKGVTPATPEHDNQFVVARDYIRGTGSVSGGAIGPAVLMGLAWCKVNWTDDAHTKVAVEEGETLLQSASSGLTPVWHEEIPDAEYLPATLWALVLIGGGGTSAPSDNIRYGRVVVTIPPATSILAADWGIVEAAVSVLDNSTGEEIDPENPITVTNRTSQQYDVDCMVELHGSIVTNGDCFPQPIEFWEPES